MSDFLRSCGRSEDVHIFVKVENPMGRSTSNATRTGFFSFHWIETFASSPRARRGSGRGRLSSADADGELLPRPFYGH